MARRRLSPPQEQQELEGAHAPGYPIRWKPRTYNRQQLRSHLKALIPDPERRKELLRLILAEAGLEEDRDGGADRG